MNQRSDKKDWKLPPGKMIILLFVILNVVAIVAYAYKESRTISIPNAVAVNKEINPNRNKKDSVESVKAFRSVYKVLMSPRCMNCHPAGDVPLQGDDSHLHTMLPQRGLTGKGVYAMKCSNCHQPENTAGLHTPPGNPNWHLPPADMKMVFQGRTPHQLAKQLIDPAQNGHKTREKLLEHADDELVLAGWNMGEGRTFPPMSHKEFKKAWETWLNKGAYAPKP